MSKFATIKTLGKPARTLNDVHCELLTLRKSLRELQSKIRELEEEGNRILFSDYVVLPNLPSQQIRVLRLVNEDLSNKEIASNMNIAERTAKFHVSMLLKKFNPNPRNRWGLIKMTRGLVLLFVTLACVCGVHAQTHSVTLTCNPSVSADVSGYNFYRQLSGSTTQTKVNISLVAICGYFDSAVDAGATYSYTARAVDSMGAESPDSIPATATIPGGVPPPPPPPPPPPGNVNCGFATVGTGTDNGDSNFITGIRCQSNGVGGTTVSVSAYIKSAVSTGAVFQGAIYADNNGNPGALLASSPSQALVTNTWNTATLPGIAITPNTFYWVAYNSNGSAAQNNMAFSPGGAAGSRKWIARTFTTGWPSTWTPSGTDASQSSLYFTYSSTVTPPPPPTPTLTIDCTKAKAAFTSTNMPAGTTLAVTGTAAGLTRTCNIPLP